MKVLTWCKFVVSSCLSISILLLAIQAKHGECISQESKNFKLKKLESDNDFLKDFTEKIKKFNNMSSIRGTYELNGQNAKSTTIKVYYDEYRKRPDFFKECYLHESVAADKVVEVFYKKHDKSISLSVKNPKHRHEKLSSKKVKIPETLTA